MRVAILGSGVIGVTSAWYLAQAGHEVTVIDRQDGPALETSFANAGEISPGYASPWAAPGIPMKALRWLFMKHAPLILRPRMDMAMLRWMVAMLGNCNERAYAINKSRMVRLAEYSRDRLIDLRRETGIAYDERSRGTLQLFREQKQLDGIAKDIAVLKADGVPFEVLDAAGCIAAEPGLAGSGAPVAGGLRLPNDETGDCFKFTNALADMAKAKGVTFLNGRTIGRIAVDNGKVSHVETDRGHVVADAYLVATGSYSPLLLAPLGIMAAGLSGEGLFDHRSDRR
ncbi:D-amino acid dehydrogenase [Sphingobium sp. YC-XJ3]|nr:D-amino acid dehydrogenase [Sphingobium sp. YC-XJ3]WDA38097.1 D-amino acid dehydrogenase [Sphingobium sp. YC-XJ3]